MFKAIKDHRWKLEYKNIYRETTVLKIMDYSCKIQDNQSMWKLKYEDKVSSFSRDSVLVGFIYIWDQDENGENCLQQHIHLILKFVHLYYVNIITHSF